MPGKPYLINLLPLPCRHAVITTRRNNPHQGFRVGVKDWSTFEQKLENIIQDQHHDQKPGELWRGGIIFPLRGRVYSLLILQAQLATSPQYSNCCFSWQVWWAGFSYLSCAGLLLYIILILCTEHHHVWYPCMQTVWTSIFFGPLLLCYAPHMTTKIGSIAGET